MLQLKAMAMQITVCVQAMLQRLQKVKPVYRISDWIDDWQKSEELTQRIAAYPTKYPVSYLLCIVGFEGEYHGVASLTPAVK